MRKRIWEKGDAVMNVDPPTRSKCLLHPVIYVGERCAHYSGWYVRLVHLLSDDGWVLVDGRDGSPDMDTTTVDVMDCDLLFNQAVLRMIRERCDT